MLLLFVKNIRLIIENYLKYGLLISLPGKSIILTDYTFAMVAVSSIPVLIFGTLSVEKWRSLNVSSLILSPLLFALHLFHFVNSSSVVYYYVEHPGLATIVIFTTIIASAKCISFSFVNSELLLPPKMNHFFYFYFAPTLCYQLNYPRSPSIRWLFVVKRFLEFIGAMLAIQFLLDQYAHPTLLNSLQSLKGDLWYLKLLERMLKLSVTSVYIWLLGFYALFHSFLNFIAEVSLIFKIVNAIWRSRIL